MARPGYPSLGVDSDPEGLAVIVKELLQLLREVNVEQLVAKRVTIKTSDGGLRVPDPLHVDKAMVRHNDDINHRPHSGEQSPEVRGLDTGCDVVQKNRIEFQRRHIFLYFCQTTICQKTTVNISSLVEWIFCVLTCYAMDISPEISE